eukprot:GHVT01061548.1.p1 GENE.GHVT01061548.1~~GHVT01061548.1.p1  ORF type:complete len:113 (+),score=20.28 GHVT01061548.1:180-518(+)
MKRPAVASPAQAEDDAKRSAVSQLDRLKKMTTVVGDTGEVDQINRLKPEDATTNPTLILKAAKMESYNYIIKDTFDKAKASGNPSELANAHQRGDLLAKNRHGHLESLFIAE